MRILGCLWLRADLSATMREQLGLSGCARLALGLRQAGPGAVPGWPWGCARLILENLL